MGYGRGGVNTFTPLKTKEDCELEFEREERTRLQGMVVWLTGEDKKEIFEKGELDQCQLKRIRQAKEINVCTSSTPPPPPPQKMFHFRSKAMLIVSHIVKQLSLSASLSPPPPPPKKKKKKKKNIYIYIYIT